MTVSRLIRAIFDNIEIANYLYISEKNTGIFGNWKILILLRNRVNSKQKYKKLIFKKI